MDHSSSDRLRQEITRLEAEVNAYFDEATDPTISDLRERVLLTLRPARDCLDQFDLGRAPDGLRGATALLSAAQKEFRHIRAHFDPAGGPKNVKSIPLA